MPTIKWNPIIEGEDLTVDRLLEPATLIADKLNAVDADCFRENGLGIDSFEGGLGVIEHSQTITTEFLKFKYSTTKWPGNPFSGEGAGDCIDSNWGTYVKPTHGSSLPLSGSTPLFKKVTGGDPYGWRWIQSHTLDHPINLKSDDSNSVLVLSEVEVEQLFAMDAKPTQGDHDYDTLDKVPGDPDPTPHVLFFTMLVAVVGRTDSTGYQDVPLPTTVRFIEGDTNTNDSSSSNSGWIKEVAPNGSGQKVKGFAAINKNMPTRTLVTYSDLASSAFSRTDGTTPGFPEGATLLHPRDRSSSAAKQIIGFKMFGTLKYCSGRFYNHDHTELEVSLRNRTISTLVLDSANTTKESHLTLTYP